MSLGKFLSSGGFASDVDSQNEKDINRYSRGGRGNEMTLRERCEALALGLHVCGVVENVDAVEAFAREIRNEALEEAATIVDMLSFENDDALLAYEGDVAAAIRDAKTLAINASEDTKVKGQQ